MKNKKLISGFIIVVIIFGLVAWFNRVDYDDIEVVMDLDEYLKMKYEEVEKIYGEPDEKDQNTYKYNLDGCDVTFNFYNLYVESIWIKFDEPLTYEKNMKELFYKFGIGEQYKNFEREKPFYGVDDRVRYTMWSNYEGPEVMGFREIDKEEKTVGEVVIFFNELVPGTKVFEADFSDTNLVLDLFQFFDKSKSDIVTTLGQPSDGDEDTWFYREFPITLRLDFNDYGKVDEVAIIFEEGIEYKKSTQEALVMFGVDCKETDLNMFFVDFEAEFYEKDGGEYQINVYGIDRDKKYLI